MRDLKDCLKNDECIVLLDFAENYSYAVQHAVHAVLLLAIIKSKNISTASVSACYQCTYLHHNANVVHIFVYHKLQSLKILLPKVSHVHYFSHGAPFQYKKIQKFIKMTFSSSIFLPEIQMYSNSIQFSKQSHFEC